MAPENQTAFKGDAHAEFNAMVTKWVLLAALFGFSSVGAGAFAAHGLEGKISEKSLSVFRLGVQYQMYHALALLGVAWLISSAPSRWASWSATCLAGGVILFSGSLYGLALCDWKWLGSVTPIGGLLLMAGWLLMGVAGCRSCGRRSPEQNRPDANSL